MLVWLDLIGGLNLANPDPEIDDVALFWHRVLTIGWDPLQLRTLLGFLYLFGTGHYDLGASDCRFCLSRNGQRRDWDQLCP